jgi:hypothetical protein
MRLFLTLRVLKRKGFRLLGGGTMKKVVMLFSLKLVNNIRNTEYTVSLRTKKRKKNNSITTHILLVRNGIRKTIPYLTGITFLPIQTVRQLILTVSLVLPVCTTSTMPVSSQLKSKSTFSQLTIAVFYFYQFSNIQAA